MNLMIRRLRAIPGYIFVGLGLLHTIVAVIRFQTLTEQALWFLSAGLALSSAGTLNIVVQGSDVPYPLRIWVVLSNLAMTVFVVVFASVTATRNLVNPLAWVLVLNSLAALALSLKRPA